MAWGHITQYGDTSQRHITSSMSSPQGHTVGSHRPAWGHISHHGAISWGCGINHGDTSRMPPSAVGDVTGGRTTRPKLLPPALALSGGLAQPQCPQAMATQGDMCPWRKIACNPGPSILKAPLHFWRRCQPPKSCMVNLFTAVSYKQSSKCLAPCIVQLCSSYTDN